MRATIALIVLLPLPLTASPLAGQEGGRAFVPADWHRVTTVSSPAMSPDGRRVAFTVTTVADSQNKRHSEVWVANTAGGDPVRFTSPGVESSTPRWSADGTLLIFSSTRPGSRSSNWALRMDQAGGEAFEYDGPPAGSLSADGKVTAWSEAATVDSSADRAGQPSSGRSRTPDGSITTPVDPARFDGRQYVELPIKGNGRGFLTNRTEPRRWRPSQIWLQAAGGEKRMITDTRYSHRSVAVSPDGKWVAFVAEPALRPDSMVEAEDDSLARLPYHAARDEAPRNTEDIYLVSASGGAPRKVASIMGVEHNLAWSPDGSRIAFVRQEHRTAQQILAVVPVAGGAVVDLTAGWQYEPASVEWLRNGRIAMSAAIGGRTAVFMVDPASKQRTEVVGGRRRVNGPSLDAGGTRMGYVATSMTRPTELFVADIDGKNERRVTSFNDRLNAEIAWADAERFTFKSVGDVEIEGWLMKPHGYQAGKKYPLTLYIHGGPHSAYGENWFDEFQNLAGAGMMVLFTNPRGSSGYGAAFTYATRGRWFAEDYQDLMKAVDIAAARPDVDSTRMGVTGGSYGGVMTAWVTAKTDRFKAAQTDRMISNWWSWYGTSDAQGLTEFEFYGKPWDNPAMYDSLSPIRYVRNVTTPTLMVQSEEDHRTPMTDAEQWFTALKKQGTPVELVRYPRSTHDLSRTGEPWLLVDRLGRLRQWFTHWLEAPPKEMTP